MAEGNVKKMADAIRKRRERENTDAPKEAQIEDEKEEEVQEALTQKLEPGVYALRDGSVITVGEDGKFITRDEQEEEVIIEILQGMEERHQTTLQVLTSAIQELTSAMKDK